MNKQPITYRSAFALLAAALLLSWTSCTTTPTHTVPKPIPVQLEE